MRVINVNTNRNAFKMKSNFSEYNPDTILIQEWNDHNKDRSAEASEKFSEYPYIAATRYLLTLSQSSFQIIHSADRILATRNSFGIIINSYSPASSGKLRREHLEKLNSLTHSFDEAPILIAGDFNMAPQPKDGWYGDDHSKFTTKSERIIFENLLEEQRIEDLGSKIDWEATFEKMNRGKLNSFRCDLALVKSNELTSWNLKYDHDYRKKKGMSDHSALILEYEV